MVNFPNTTMINHQNSILEIKSQLHKFLDAYNLPSDINIHSLFIVKLARQSVIFMSAVKEIKGDLCTTYVVGNTYRLSILNGSVTDLSNNEKFKAKDTLNLALLKDIRDRVELEVSSEKPTGFHKNDSIEELYMYLTELGVLDEFLISNVDELKIIRASNFHVNFTVTIYDSDDEPQIYEYKLLLITGRIITPYRTIFLPTTNKQHTFLSTLQNKIIKYNSLTPIVLLETYVRELYNSLELDSEVMYLHNSEMYFNFTDLNKGILKIVYSNDKQYTALHLFSSMELDLNTKEISIANEKILFKDSKSSLIFDKLIETAIIFNTKLN